MAAANGNIKKKPRLDLALHKQHSICLVLDYGSQYTQLIARRVRENGVYSMLVPGDVTLVRGFVISISFLTSPIRKHAFFLEPSFSSETRNFRF
jgi:hypothetical protein